MTVLKRPGAQQVVVTWLKSLPELSGTGVATTLPPTTQWTSQDFVTVGPSLGGIPSAYLMQRVPVVQIDCWAKAPSSDRPAWNRASVIAEAIRDATYGSSVFAELTVPGGFIPVKLNDVALRSEPRRMQSDVSAIARYMLTLSFTYALKGLVST